MSLSEMDWDRLNKRFDALEQKVERRDSAVHKLELEMTTLKVGSVHKCAEAIEKHESSSWAHNPYKATGLLGAAFGVVEAFKKFLSH